MFIYIIFSLIIGLNMTVDFHCRERIWGLLWIILPLIGAIFWPVVAIRVIWNKIN